MRIISAISILKKSAVSGLFLLFPFLWLFVPDVVYFNELILT